MKKYILVIHILLLCIGVKAQWVSTNGPIGGVNSLFQRGSELYAAGYESFFRSEKGGAWEKITIGTKAVNVTCFTEFGGTMYIGTQKSGIYFSSDGRNWTPIQNNEKLQDSLRVSAITTVGAKLLANVYHFGSHGNHSRIYEFEEEGKNLKQAIEFDSHLYVYSFTYYTANKVLMATDEGIYIYDMSENVPPKSLSSKPTVQIVFAGTTFFGVPARETNKIYRWNNDEDDEDSWDDRSIGLDEYITNLAIRPDGYYATTYSGIYFSTINNLRNPWSRLVRGMSMDYLYVSSITFQDPNKFVATNKGVFKSIGNGDWNSFNDNLASSHVNSLHVHNDIVYAGTANGLFRSALKNYSWVNVPHDLFKLYTETTHFASIGKVLFIGTDNGILKSGDGKTWTEVHNSIPLPSDFPVVTYYSHKFTVQSLVSSGNSLFAATYETPYISVDMGETWEEHRTGLPSGRVIKALRVIDDQIYLFLEEFASVHDVWFASLKTSIYKFNKTTTEWNEISKYTGNSRYQYPAVLGKTLVFLHEVDGVRHLKSINTENVAAGMKNLALPKTEPWYINNIFVLQQNIFITTYIGETFVSFDKGSSWEVFKQLPAGVSSISTMLEKDNIMYAGLAGHGVWTRPYPEFFLPQVSTSAAKNITARTISISGNVSTKGNHAATPFFDYAKNRNFTPVIGSVKGTPGVVNGKNQAVAANLSGLEGNTDYYIRLRGTVAGNFSAFSDTIPFKTLNYIGASSTGVPVIDADITSHKVTEEIASKAPVVLTLTSKVDSVSVTLNTRGLADDKWKTTLATSVNETYNVILPYDQFDELGLQYYFTIVPPYAYRDPKQSSIVTDTSNVAIRHPAGLSFKEKIQFGTTAEDYNFISFPLHLKETDIASILAGVLSSNTDPDPTRWRLLTYVGENGSYKEIWDEYPATRAKVVSPGRGYWLAVAENLGSDLIATGEGTTVANFPISDDTGFGKDHFVIKLTPGYNQIGNPFLYKVKWSDVKAANGPNVGDLIVYNSENGTLIRNNQDAILEPFSGGYVSNNSNVAIGLKIPTKKNLSINGRKASEPHEFIEDSECYVSFTISNGNRICKLGGLGIIADASKGNDLYDLIAPPSPGNFPSIIFSDDESLLKTRSLVPPEGEGQQWNFNTQSVYEDQETSISWNTFKISAGTELWLHDLLSENLINMTSADQYKFIGSRRFRVYYGSPAYIKDHMRPENTVLYIYPNPIIDNAVINFALDEDQNNSDVKFSVVDLKGQEVPLTQRINYEAGFHSLEWNLSNFHLARGLYLLKMEVSSPTSTKIYYKKVIR